MIEKCIIKYREKNDPNDHYIYNKIISSGNTSYCAKVVQGLLNPCPNERLSVEMAL